MLLMELKWRPSNKELRSFGLVAMIMLTIIGVLLHWWKGISITSVLGLATLGLLLFIISRVREQFIKPVYIVLQLIALPIGMTVSFVLIALFYYMVITPIGLYFRIIGRDPLCRKFDRQADTYWVQHKTVDSVDRYFKQF
jgi:hypothetical protein